jgi:hypothetical protein
MVKLRDGTGGLSAMYTLHSLSPGSYKLGLLLQGDLTDALEDTLDKVRFGIQKSDILLIFPHVSSLSHYFLKSMSENIWQFLNRP